MTPKSSYHHGDLRKALLSAAELELKAQGIEKFSLRGVARTAGVSHAAPAHHFGDATGLLTALAVVGWERFVAAQRRYQAKADPDPLEQMIAATRGYVAFASDNTALFQLLFSSNKPNRCDPAFQSAGDAAFAHLVGLVSALSGKDPDTHPDAMMDVHGSWALVHGIASLLNNDYLSSVNQSKRERDAAIRAIISRFWR